MILKMFLFLCPALVGFDTELQSFGSKYEQKKKNRIEFVTKVG